MKAVIPSRTDGEHPCVIYWTGRVRLSVRVITWCNDDRDASDGVLQVPEATQVCADCDQAISDLRYPSKRR